MIPTVAALGQRVWPPKAFKSAGTASAAGGPISVMANAALTRIVALASPIASINVGTASSPAAWPSHERLPSNPGVSLARELAQRRDRWPPDVNQGRPGKAT